MCNVPVAHDHFTCISSVLFPRCSVHPSSCFDSLYIKFTYNFLCIPPLAQLAQDPNVLTLHYRMGADPEQTKRRTYKLVTKDAFVAV